MTKLSNLAGESLFFKVSVNCKFVNEPNAKDEYYDDICRIMFPENYTDDGEPFRLIVACHGAGGSIDTDDHLIAGQALTKYLLANGYVVLDVNGLPVEFCEKYNVDVRNNVGTHIAVDCYVKAYQYCIEHFNLKDHVIVNGGSMGGISSTNLVLKGGLPVIAHCALCPVLDTYNQIFLHPWTSGAPKRALATIFSFDKDENGEIIYDESKVNGYNPVNNPDALKYPVPLKFWQCEDDNIVSIEVTKKYVNALKNAGNDVEFVIFPTGGHEPQLYGEDLDNPKWNDVYKGEKIKGIKPAVEGVIEFISYYDNLYKKQGL